MKKDSVTNMLEVDDLKVLVYSISKNPLKYMIIERVARKVKEILLHGRGLLFNSAERLMLRVDLTVDFDDDGENCVAVIRAFSTVHYY